MVATAGSGVAAIAVQVATAHGRRSRVDGTDSDRKSEQLFTFVVASGLAAAWAASALHVVALAGWGPVAFGLVALWTGVGIRSWAIHSLGEHYDPVVRVHEAHRLVVSGPYRYVQHPVYSGLLLTYAGIGLAVGWLASVGLATVPVFRALRYRMSVEEAALAAHFGAASLPAMADERDR